MLSSITPPWPIRNFFNVRRQASIEWLRSIHVDPFQSFKCRDSGKDEDFYIHVMNERPKPVVETDWELNDMHEHSENLAVRIAAARARR
jgi:hypothetical protein